MNILIYSLFVSIFSLDYLALGIQVIPRILSWIPDLLAGLAFVLVVLRIAAKQQFTILPKYIILFSIFSVLIFTGIVTNSVPSGAVFAGLRNDFRYIPFFLLPLVYSFNENQIRGQIRLLLFLLIIQLPLALYQRFFQYSEFDSGDVVKGTFNSPAWLSLTLIFSIAVAMGFFLKKRLSLTQLAILCFLFVIPASINETTVTFIILPLAFMLPVLLSKGFKNKKLIVMASLAICIVMTGLFVGVYNHLYGKRWGGNILTIFSSDKASSYLYKGADEDAKAGAGYEQSEIGRVDSIVLACKILWEDSPVLMLIGVGIGNASQSFSEKFKGEFSDLAYEKGAFNTTVSFLIWEVGVIGLFVSLLFLYMVFMDARRLSVNDGLKGALSLGFTGIIPIIALSFLYKNFVSAGQVSFLMWYFLGLIIHMRWCDTYRFLPSHERNSTHQAGLKLKNIH